MTVFPAPVAIQVANRLLKHFLVLKPTMQTLGQSKPTVPEAGRQVNREILVSLLKPVVLLDMMQVISPDHNGAVHFHTFDNASQNTSTDVNSSSERTLLVNVSSLICLFHEMKRNLLSLII